MEYQYTTNFHSFRMDCMQSQACTYIVMRFQEFVLNQLTLGHGCYPTMDVNTWKQGYKVLKTVVHLLQQYRRKKHAANQIKK